jgi:hypothetical protein
VKQKTSGATAFSGEAVTASTIIAGLFFEHKVRCHRELWKKPEFDSALHGGT